MDSFSFAFNQFGYSLALITWLGCDFMSIVSAPVIFRLSCSRELAGDLNGEIIKRLNRIKWAGVIIVGATVTLRFAKWDEENATDLTRLALLTLMGGAALLSASTISPLARKARAYSRSRGSRDVQNNVAFRRLHGALMLMLLIEMTAGVSVWFFN